MSSKIGASLSYESANRLALNNCMVFAFRHSFDNYFKSSSFCSNEYILNFTPLYIVQNLQLL